MRIASGIRGFDELVGGGIPENSVVLLTGEVGTGNTILGLQFLCTAKEPGVFVSFDSVLWVASWTPRKFVVGMPASKQTNIVGEPD